MRMGHGTSVAATASVASRSQLDAPASDVPVRTERGDRVVEHADDHVVRTEVGAVLVREVDGSGDRPGGAEPPELVELGVACVTRQRRLNGGYRSVTRVKA